jgi:hypothetical protein
MQLTKEDTMSSTPKTSEADTPIEAELAALVARYDELIHGDVHKDCDCHWQVGERWSYGEPAGWFIEHHGYVYELRGSEYGEQGPFRTREQALRALSEQLRMAIAEVGEHCGG